MELPPFTVGMDYRLSLTFRAEISFGASRGY